MAIARQLKCKQHAERPKKVARLTLRELRIGELAKERGGDGVK